MKEMLQKIQIEKNKMKSHSQSHFVEVKMKFNC